MDNYQKQTAEAVRNWLEKILPIAEPTPEQSQALRELLGHPGLACLVGLMLGSRQTAFVQLANSPLDSTSAVARASVIQGQIKGIDLLRDTLLEQAIPAQADNSGAAA